ncbi:MAG: hypothetical protein JST30_09400 [Armatimonadetes bacterium]|nr:hypothetical protein [Armatimonadota bacterium]
MTRFQALNLTFLVAVAALAGCGGSQVAEFQHLPKGEGNIPIGKAQGLDGGESNVLVEYSDGHKSEIVTNDQTVFSSPMPEGKTKVTVYPSGKGYSKTTIEFDAGSEQNYQFNIRPLPVSVSSRDVLFISSIRDGQVFKIGQQYDLNIKILGPNTRNLRPTVYLSGGFGRLSTDDKLTPTRTGSGDIVVQVKDVKKSFHVFVEP